ncbi:hypothetical protein ACLOJK_038729 [Asimina triloba]
MAGLVGVSFFSVWFIPLIGISVLSAPLVPLVCPSVSLIPFIGVSFFSVFLVPFVPPHLSIFENLVYRNLPCHRLPKTCHLLWICWLRFAAEALSTLNPYLSKPFHRLPLDLHKKSRSLDLPAIIFDHTHAYHRRRTAADMLCFASLCDHSL